MEIAAETEETIFIRRKGKEMDVESILNCLSEPLYN